MTKKQVQLVSYWIIRDAKFNSIWKQPFLIEFEASREWEKNKTKFLSEGWVLEKLKTWRDVTELDLSEKILNDW